jgi:Kef-type K+ transport system membrane component KefB
MNKSPDLSKKAGHSTNTPDAVRPTFANRLRTFFGYVLMLTTAVGLFLLIRWMGKSLQAPLAPKGVDGSTSQPAESMLFHVLLALAVIIVTTRVMGSLFGYLKQPAVVGEVVGGILLGPSLLGQIAPGFSSAILPETVAPYLAVIAQIGVILYMFLVGLELDLGVILRRGHATVAVSHASIIVPFILGSILALGLYPTLGTREVGFTVFALFFGAALSVTAFPMLARILTDRGLQRTQMGSIALTCAAVDDVTAWCLLALVVSIAQARPIQALWTLGLTIAYVLFVLIIAARVVRYALPFFERSGSSNRGTLAIILVAVLFSALATEYIGVHAIFGAFICGAIIPSGTRLAAELRHRLEDIVAVLLLPAFFAFTGMRTQIGLVSGAWNWLFCAAIILVACLGKFGGTFLAARFTGLGWRDSASLGVLMNTRGLVELIVLNVGLDLGVISPTLFAMMVLMALVTTFMTTPILNVIVRGHSWAEPGTPVQANDDGG